MLLSNYIPQETDLSFEPKFFRIYDKKDKTELDDLIKNNPGIKIFDEIEIQLDELIKTKYPKNKPGPTELEKLKLEHVGKLTKLEYGVWVYYPWNNSLIHLLDKEEFIEVRTNRNTYKITKEERDILGKQKIGVVGLSVGQSVSVTMAMERGFGEIRLADFDLLELTNMNRIRTGVQSLGLPKVVIVAREIKEIDPFLHVICFSDGLTEENMDRFFSEGGNLDLIVDECDGLDIKILLRHKAKSLRIPVVMDMSDRGTLDVERFDLEPDRPILHGMIDHLDHTKVKFLKTNEEKIPYLLAMIGVETLSNRLQASMCEVGQTISTWPQLASGVTLGGALCADVSRRIILDQYHESGRYYIDLEQLIGNKTVKKETDYLVKDYTSENLSDAEMKSATDHLKNDGLLLGKEELEQLVSAAILAPSSGNNQPWKWLINKQQLFLFHDDKHSVSWGDFDNITSNISFGAAIENLKIEAGKLNLEVICTYFPVLSNKRLVASFSFTRSSGKPYLQELAPALGLRLTNRKKGNKEKISAQIISSLTEITALHSEAKLTILDREDQIKEIADIVSKVEKIRFLYPQGHHDFYTQEIRWTQKSVEETRTGLDIRSLELSESDKTGLRVAANPEVIKLLNEWDTGAAFEKLSKGAILTSSGIGLITMPFYSPEYYLKGGQAMQRAWLSANLNGLSFHPISAPLFLFARLIQGNGDGMTKKMIEELSILNESLKNVFPVLNSEQGIFMFRLSFADEASVRSLRRPLEEVIQFNN
jgi:tRNA A37 threonylcarbamoyladenosine dehydratase/nitroreductase